MLRLEKIFNIYLQGKEYFYGYIFMGKVENKQYFSCVYTCSERVSCLWKSQNSREIYDKAKDWFNSQFDGFINVSDIKEAEYSKLEKIFKKIEPSFREEEEMR